MVGGSFLLLCSSISLTIALGSLSLLSDARQLGHLESWLGGYGLVDGWVVTGCLKQHDPPTTFVSLLSHARQRKDLVLRWVGVCAGGGCNINIRKL